VDPLCRGCRAELRPLPAQAAPAGGVPAWAPVAYDGPARALVGALKYRGAAGLADALAAQIAARCPPDLLAGATLVPAPAHPSRARRRGYDQAERLAAALASRTGLPVARPLARRGPARQQKGRARVERLSGPFGSVFAREQPPDRCLLVDDVITTGATLAACAACLRRAGAGGVAALAYARTPAR